MALNCDPTALANTNFQENLESYSVHVCLFIMKGEGWPFRRVRIM
jgi:hypothetical protein